MKKLNVVGAIIAGAGAILGTIIGDLKQRKAIEEAVDERFASMEEATSEEEINDEEEEES